jgi:hypothetical protein
MYSYNYQVNKLLTPEEVKFYGYSDIDRTIEYILNNDIKNQRIILVTDDDGFNYSTAEIKS